jgi:group I intron endonuclease
MELIKRKKTVYRKRKKTVYRKRKKTVRDYIVYLHRSPSGKCYVGLTKDYDRRCLEHKKDNRCRLFARAIEKYGWDNLEHTILESGLTLKEAKDKESYYIEKYNTFVPNGYNLTTGGEGYIVSDETRKNMSQAHKGEVREYLRGKNLSEEHKRKISEAMKNITKETREKLSYRAKNKTEEHQRKITEALTGQKRSDETRQRQAASAKRRKKRERDKRLLEAIQQCKHLKSRSILE